MAMSGAGAEDETGRSGPQKRVRRVLRRSFVSGTAILLPLAVTLLLLEFVLRFVSSRLTPVTRIIQKSVLIPDDTQLFLVKGLTVGTLVGIVFLLGFLAEFSPRGSRIGDTFDELMGAVPGLGSVYTSFNQMSEILLDSDTDSFQDVKLVEYPTPHSYTVAFKTAETPPEIEKATATEEMVTLFMPLAPNPVMGGFVVHVTTDRVIDVDMTVEEGIRSIVTSGVAVDENGASLEGLSPQEMRRLGHFNQSEKRRPNGQEGPSTHSESRELLDEGDVKRQTSAERRSIECDDSVEEVRVNKEETNDGT